MSEWQPIETAPKDGTPIIGAIRGSVAYVCWFQEDAWVFWESDGRPNLPVRMAFSPTHWMPLPEPPK